jgi:hypothetical protein
MSKSKFNNAERFAVFLHGDRRCWLCTEPLRFQDLAIDHVLPESLLDRPSELRELLLSWGLPDGYDINGYENLAPAHHACNLTKSDKKFAMTMAFSMTLSRIRSNAAKVTRTVDAIARAAAQDSLLSHVATAIESGKLSPTELADFLAFFGLESNGNKTEKFLHLDNGYYVKCEDIVYEGPCECELQSVSAQTPRCTATSIARCRSGFVNLICIISVMTKSSFALVVARCTDAATSDDSAVVIGPF